MQRFQEKMKRKKSDWGSSYWNLAWIIPLVVILWWGVTWFLTALSQEPLQKGLVGERFGAVNALFSGLAFGILIFTMHLQRKDLELQREELTLSRGELRGQKEQLEKQNRTLSLQSLENTFFHLVDLHRLQVKDATTNSSRLGMAGAAVYEGREAFNRISGRLLQNVGVILLYASHSTEQKLTGVLNVYLDLYEKNEMVLSGYFRLLYNAIVLIDRSEILSTEDKKKYVRILRAQLVNAELVLLLFNCLSPYGEKFKPYVEKYALLKHLQKDTGHFTLMSGMYAPSAYGQ